MNIRNQLWLNWFWENNGDTIIEYWENERCAFSIITYGNIDFDSNIYVQKLVGYVLFY